MKNILFIFIALVLSFNLIAQENKNVIIHLKNGNTIQGTIIEQTDKIVKIKTINKSILEYSINDVDKVDTIKLVDKKVVENKILNKKVTNKSPNILDASIILQGGVNRSAILEKIFYLVPFTSSMFGYDMGISGNIKLSKLLSLQLGFIYEKKGYKFYDSINLKSWDSTKTLSCLTIPIMLNIKSNGNIKFVGRLGAYYSHIKPSIINDNYNTYSYNTFVYKNNAKKNDLGLIVALGTEIPISRKINLLIQGRFNQDLIKITDNIEQYYKIHKMMTYSLDFGIIYYLKDKY